ncbi:hypothetical protein AG1IA_06955 [Rhizoctonia solani AG-1 IA]|uniref:Uncharacterized protein n=1 Tax=Thanatephorus cucumeris (strain AG1-IA) TaxID=983506 RepID=L8WLG9_THACA|nr:hypothetical protein AG1IA_06955 [Rhizoctonia solani AG-1 IA]
MNAYTPFFAWHLPSPPPVQIQSSLFHRDSVRPYHALARSPDLPDPTYTSVLSTPTQPRPSARPRTRLPLHDFATTPTLRVNSFRSSPPCAHLFPRTPSHTHDYIWVWTVESICSSLFCSTSPINEPCDFLQLPSAHYGPTRHSSPSSPSLIIECSPPSSLILFFPPPRHRFPHLATHLSQRIRTVNTHTEHRQHSHRRKV